MPFRIISIGEILHDVYPNGRRLGGAPFSFAFHMHRFGCQVAFVSRTGRDEAGQAIVGELQSLDFPADHIQLDDNHPTGSVAVRLTDHNAPTFDILTDTAYDYIEHAGSISTFAASPVHLIYFGTLAQRHGKSRDTIRSILALAQKETLTFLDLNLRQELFDREVMLDSLQRADILKLNGSELGVVRKLFGFHGSDEQVVRELVTNFDIGSVWVTRGEEGGTVYTASNTVRQIPDKRLRPIVDTVGAGDAYAAVVAFGVLSEWPIPLILQRAGDFASAICSIPGALSKEDGFYRTHAPWIT
jgi:fructokinase